MPFWCGFDWCVQVLPLKSSQGVSAPQQSPAHRSGPACVSCSCSLCTRSLSGTSTAWHGLFPPLSEGPGQPCLWFWMVKCEFWRAMGCRSGFATGFQLWWDCTGNGSCGRSVGAEQGQVFPKPRRAVPMAGVDPGPQESPPQLAGGLDQGFVLRHRVWQVPLCPPLAHTWDVSVFAMQSSSELPTS